MPSSATNFAVTSPVRDAGAHCKQTMWSANGILPTENICNVEAFHKLDGVMIFLMFLPIRSLNSQELIRLGIHLQNLRKKAEPFHVRSCAWVFLLYVLPD